MKIHILSDLHLSFHPMERPVSDADLVILAGDISRPHEAIAWAEGFDKPVLYVAGNHEYYGASIPATLDEMHRQCQGTQVQVLDERSVVIGGVRFLGCTLWTDFALFGDGEERIQAMAQAQRHVRDYSRIHATGASAETLLVPADTAALFARHSRWLEGELAKPHDGATVVITHHAPSPESIHPRFAGSPVNAGFVSRAGHLLDANRVQLWVHGHTHDSFDYRLNGTRVLCNPRGYARNGVNENMSFNPQLRIDVA